RGALFRTDPYAHRRSGSRTSSQATVGRSSRVFRSLFAVFVAPKRLSMAELRRQSSSFATLGCHAFSGRFLQLNGRSLTTIVHSQDANERIAILLTGPRTGIDFQTIRSSVSVAGGNLVRRFCIQRRVNQ